MPDAHIILAGDSNALGFLNNGPAPYELTARVQIWTGSEWNYMRPGVNTGTETSPLAWGPEVGIANRWLADNATGYLWIVKEAKGGTTLANDWAPNGDWFANTTRETAEAMHNLDGTQFAFSEYQAAFVGLGENDANAQMAPGYLDRLVAFDFAARAAWHVGELVEWRITAGAGDAASNETVRQAQWQADMADPLMTSFKTIGFAMQPDGVHYADHVQLGNAAYEGWVL